MCWNKLPKFLPEKTYVRVSFLIKITVWLFTFTFDFISYLFRSSCLHEIFKLAVLLLDFASILKAITMLLLLHFDSCLAEVIMICLTKKLTPFLFSRSEMFGKMASPKKVRTFLGKCQRWNPVLIKLQGNVLKCNLDIGVLLEHFQF